jgi:hypothetical protein
MQKYLVHLIRVYGSAFNDRAKHFWILVPSLQNIVLISSILLRNLSVELCYVLYI